jgi:5'-nucleotidase
MTRPLLLLTNDDGIESPGLRAVAEAVLDLGDIVVAAPRHQQSSTGRSLLGNRDEALRPWPFEVRGRAVPAYACNATPALTVLHAVHVLGGARQPDLVVSGINYGENLGANITISGTIGAALEAASHGIPALAVSVQTVIDFHHRHGDVEWTAAVHFARLFAAKLLAGRLPPDVDVLSVNVPEDATPATPWRVTRLSRRSYFSVRMNAPRPDSPIREQEVGVFLAKEQMEHGSDIRALAHERVVSVTPLSLDLTSRVEPALLEGVLRGAEGGAA